MTSSPNNIFQNSSSSRNSMIFGSNKKLGSYRFEPGRSMFRLQPHQINSHWDVNLPASLTTQEELLHLSSTELRVEDYYLIRNKLITPQHQQMIINLIKQNAFNPMLIQVPCNTLALSIFSQPYDVQRIRIENNNKKASSSKNSSSNIFGKNANGNTPTNTSRNTCSNIFSTNQDVGLTKVAPPTYIYGRSSSANSIYQPIVYTSNNQYRPNNNTNTIFGSNNPTGNIFGTNVAKDQTTQTPSTNQPIPNQPNPFNNINNTNPNNIFNRNSIPINCNIFKCTTCDNNNITTTSNDIFNRNNIFQSNPYNPIPHQQNISTNVKKSVEISIKIAENNVVYQKIVTTDNNIKIYLDCSQFIQQANLREQNTTYNSVIVPKSEWIDKATDRTKEERQRRMPEKEKERSTMPMKREQHVTIHNFDEKEQALEEGQTRKCDFALKLRWLEEGREERYIKGSIDIEGLFLNDVEWCKRFIKQLKLSHPVVRNDAQLEGLVCKIDPKGYAMITGTIAQWMFNLLNYEVQYEKLTSEYAEGLKITNKHGSISWQQPVRFIDLDFQEFDFAIKENEVMMPSNSPLNTACVVTFYRLPARVQMMLEEDDYDGAFDRLSRIVEKTCPGTASLKVLNEHFWRMQVAKFS